VSQESQKTSQPVKLQLKLRSGLTKAQRETVTSVAREAGAARVRPLFPGSTDAELADLYMVDVDSAAETSKLIEALEKHPAVEFVEREVRRKLKDR
jgi:cell division protein FtsX